MTSNMPMKVVRPVCILNPAPLANDPIVLIDDGDPSRLGHAIHPIKQRIALGAHEMHRQDDEPEAVAVRTFFELIQAEGGVVQGSLNGARQIPPRKQSPHAPAFRIPIIEPWPVVQPRTEDTWVVHESRACTFGTRYRVP